MRIAVMAAGAVGGYFGGRMAAAGHDVAFIARGAHRDAIRRDGLKIESALGDLHLKDVNVTDDPTQVGPVDVVLFAVKLWDTETAGEQTCPLLGPDSRVITLQNGVDSVERLASILGEEAVIAGTTYVVTTIPEERGHDRLGAPIPARYCDIAARTCALSLVAARSARRRRDLRQCSVQHEIAKQTAVAHHGALRFPGDRRG
jgi:ketopantoate reductase